MKNIQAVFIFRLCAIMCIEGESQMLFPIFVFMNFFYHAFGLVIESQVECPELMPDVGQSTPDVQIRLDDAPFHLDHGMALGDWIEGCSGQILLKITNVANYWIHDGQEIVVDAAQGVSPEDVRIYLLGSAMGAVLHQRGLLPFHGSTICMDGQAISFSGPSGIGKSTLAAALVGRGYRMLADDVSAISFTGQGVPMVNPGMPQLKLCDDSGQQLGRNPSSACSLGNRARKCGYPEHAAFITEALPSKAIYILGRHAEDGFKEIPLKGVDKFHALRINTYRPSFVKAMGLELTHFDLLKKLAGHIDVRVLLRPADGFRIDELADKVSPPRLIHHILPLIIITYQ
ncbi:MAG: hypothetical protein LBL24_07710 [Bacteroidales bacterium]|jgi:hypothetical protein|nr:hypothetical protein [Bacteroidales bacterium]